MENKQYSIDELLSICPSEIASASVKAEDSRFLWKEAEIKSKRLEAIAYLKFKSERSDLKIEDLKNLVNNSESIYEQRLATISHESEYKKEMIQVDRWVNLFNTARKKANLEIERMRSLHTTVGGKA